MTKRESDAEPDRFLGVDDEVLRSLIEGVAREEPLILRLTVGIGAIRLTVPEICRTAPGDLLNLEPLDDEVVVSFEGVPLYRGRLVLFEEKIFLRVSNNELDRSDREGRVAQTGV